MIYETQKAIRIYKSLDTKKTITELNECKNGHKRKKKNCVTELNYSECINKVEKEIKPQDVTKKKCKYNTRKILKTLFDLIWQHMYINYKLRIYRKGSWIEKVGCPTDLFHKTRTHYLEFII